MLILHKMMGEKLCSCTKISFFAKKKRGDFLFL